MFLIFLVPIVGILFAVLINKIFPKAQFKGYDFLPLFFIPACNIITNFQKRPSFIPYGFLFFFILAIILTLGVAIKEKNISLSKMLHELWRYLSLSSIIWYLGLLFVMMVWIPHFYEIHQKFLFKALLRSAFLFFFL